MEKSKISLGLRGFGAAVLESARPTADRIAENPWVCIATVSALDFSVAAILSNACFLTRYAPLGTAYAAACACGSSPKRLNGRGKWAVRLSSLAGIAGAVCGSLLFAHGESLRYLAACAVLLAGGMILRGTEFFRRRWFLPCMTAFAMLSCGMAFMWSTEGLFEADGSGNALDFCLLSGETALTAAAAMLYDRFRQGIRPWAVGRLTGQTVSGSLGNWTLARTERRVRTEQRVACIAAIASLGAVLCHFDTVAGIRPGNLLAALGVLAASCVGSFPAAAAGLIFGCALDLSRYSTPLYAAVYGLCGLFTGLYYRRSALSVVLAFIAVNALTIGWHSQPISALLESFVAGILFLMFSGKLAALGQLLFSGNTERSVSAVTVSEELNMLRRKADSISTAFAALGKLCMPNGMEVEQSPAEIHNDDVGFASDKGDLSVFHVATERTCKGCTMREICWEQDAAGSRQALKTAAENVLRRGYAMREDFPSYFTERCVRQEDFLFALNTALAAASYRKRFQRREKEDNRLICAQYDGMTQILGELMDEFRTLPQEDAVLSDKLTTELAAHGITGKATVWQAENGRLTVRIRDEGTLPRNLPTVVRQTSEILGRAMTLSLAGGTAVESDQEIRLREREALRVTVGVSRRKKAGEACNGDTSLCFRMPDGRVCLLLSDGMGAGKTAERQSTALTHLLESFLKAGIQPQTALRLVCPAFALRSDGESFASVDLLTVDLYTGKAAFYKCGAAPSYVMAKGEAVRRIASASLPAGLFAPGSVSWEKTTLSLKAGDTIVLLSDGVNADSEDPEFIRKLSRKTEEDWNVGDLAESLLAETEPLNDDATVLLLKLNART